jgi:hypothetical protein
MVHAALFQEMAERLLTQRSPHSAAVTLKVHPRSISKMKGLKRANVDALSRKFNLCDLSVEPDPSLPEDGLRIKGGETALTYRQLAKQRLF